MVNVVDRFLKYTQTETTSDPKSGLHPSTPSQLMFARQIADELIGMGMRDVSVDDRAYVVATLPANGQKQVPVIGFIAHLDTSPDFSARNVRPRMIEQYPGGNIILNETLNIVLSPDQFPELENYIGQTLITTDGTTLLGADDKAGIAEIISAMEYLLAHPEIEHGEIQICFTPDEEIGEGADHFDFDRFRAEFAYTLDGDEIGVLEYENFNAAYAQVSIQGRSVHPGSAKNKMINSMLIACRLISMLPAAEIPEKTEGYEGFFHLLSIEGSIELTKLELIIRDHDRGRFGKRKALLEGVVNQLNLEYGAGTVQLELRDQYYNMLEQIKPVMQIIDLARQAMTECGIEPRVKAIRGGTDGARLSYMGLPCPNLFAGGLNFHGKYEFIPVQSMEKAVDVILQIIKKHYKNSIKLN